MTEVEVFAPATVSNVGCGFDVLGFAIEGVGDRLSVTLRDQPGVEILSIEGAGGTIPRAPAHNTAGVAALTLLEGVGERNRGLSFRIHKGIAAGSGLGSSAASAVAAVLAADEILELELPSEQLLTFALEGERIASGGVLHADNVAPCLFGGFVAVRSLHPPDVVEIPVPRGLCCALVRPHIQIQTSESRALLGNAIPLSTAVHQWANVAGLVAGLFRDDWDLISRSLEDVVAEPVRGSQVPGFQEMKEAAIESGALGCSLSGSGPTVFALCRGPETAEAAADAMLEAVGKATGLAADRHTTTVGAGGARLLQVT